jgi:hypothetical protein
LPGDIHAERHAILKCKLIDDGNRHRDENDRGESEKDEERRGRAESAVRRAWFGCLRNGCFKFDLKNS